MLVPCKIAQCGICILTSQLLSNIYLDQLDKFVINKLNIKYYGRYVDDFYLIIKNFVI